MNRFWIVSLMLLLAPATSRAEDWARKMFTSTSHDFGSVARGATVHFEFKLKNVYQETLHIAGVRSSCGCTTPKVVSDTLKTYEEGGIIAELNTQAYSGQKNATITVIFDRPFYAEVQLNVSGYIRTDVVLTPGGAEFGTVDVGTGADKKVTLTYSGRSDWKITELKSSSNHVSATLSETSRSPGQVTYQLQVNLLPTAPAGSLKEQIILTSNDTSASEVPVDVEARIMAPVTVSPAALFLGVLEPGQKVTKQLVVQAKKPFKITRVTCEDAGFQFQTSDATKTVHLVPVTFTAGDNPGKITRKIHIATDLGPDATQDLAAYAQILAADAVKK
ncbi:MAG: DUF1573 domain-containing protein [Planctomycetes bacterium]|nr:DUF1573 domain-containing protein [Planctomycetota bacterium]